jgi:hypothetical protein
MCGQETDETFPAVWSLAPAAGRPFHPSTSLLEAQVVDGATLYLRDVVEGETDEPVVTALEELIEEAGDGWARWNGLHRAWTILPVGLGALVAAVIVLVIGSPGELPAGLAAIVTGLGLALLARFAGRRNWPVPAPLRLTLALAACPVLALAGYALPVAQEGGVAAAIAVVLGGNVGALAALWAVPNVWTLTVESFAVVALPVTVLLAAFGASLVECAAVVGVAALALLSGGPNLAGSLVMVAPAGPGRPAPTDSAAEISAVMDRSRRVLAALAMSSSLICAGCLLVLGGSDDVFAVALALCLSLALLARAEQNTVPAAVMPVLAAGAAGLVTVVIRAPVRLWDGPAMAGPLVAWVVGAGALGAGVMLAMRSPQTSDTRPSWLGSAGTVLTVLTVPLAVGVFGVFQYLADLGGRL